MVNGFLFQKGWLTAGHIALFLYFCSSNRRQSMFKQLISWIVICIQIIHCVSKIIFLVCNDTEQPKVLLDIESMNQYDVYGGDEGHRGQ